MDKHNYRESLEKDRQEITVDNSSEMSRRAQRNASNQKSKKGSSLLLPSLFFIFILIPVTILIYVAFLYEPDDTPTIAQNENEVSFETNSPSQETPIVPLEEEAEKEEPEVKEEEKPVEEEPAEEEVSEEQKEEKPAEPAEQPKEEEPAAEPEEPAEPEAPAEPAEPVQSQKTVIVKESETLYRIAVNNYGASGAAAAVEKIKQANGLASNEIYAGQTLILP